MELEHPDKMDEQNYNEEDDGKCLCRFFIRMSSNEKDDPQEATNEERHSRFHTAERHAVILFDIWASPTDIVRNKVGSCCGSSTILPGVDSCQHYHVLLRIDLSWLVILLCINSPFGSTVIELRSCAEAGVESAGTKPKAREAKEGEDDSYCNCSTIGHV